ncbi:DUF418 domain-containing protein [Massilia sp. TWR1-2-2]|uniref:DUF418 domain-containing protein n=1 Tax=Massilia sp. TWR1-2-2 TaxID=2804584 RepID=UPI003CF5E5E8
MHTLTDSPQAVELAPVPTDQRIEALDVVRGFALIGICLMNVEFFNRATGTVGQGMPAGLTGIDWLASLFVAYFVTGKFWTIFSMLFGMGFAVMLTRAESAGRGFFKPYLRRIAALAIFGLLHYIFLFAGDILFSYAVAAVFLLVVLYGKAIWIVAAIGALIGLALLPGFGPAAGGAAGSLALCGLVALYLRSERRPFGLSVMSLMLLVIGAIGAIAAVVMWLIKAVPMEARGPVTAASVLFLVLSFLAQRYRDPLEKRPLRAGAAMYLLLFTMMTIGGLATYLTPPAAVVPVAAPAAAVASADQKKAAAKPDLAKEPEKAEAAALKARKLKEDAAAIANENKVMSTGSYADMTALRLKHFGENAPMQGSFAIILVAMFLIGTWFIRAGVMANTAAHLPLFRKLAYIGLPGGIALGLAGAFISTGHVPGADHDGFMFALGLQMLGNLPACLGYVAMNVLMLHSDSAFSKVKVLGPFGRMALTNYLLQSVVMSMFFFGYGLGNWGMGRAMQLLFALALCALQIVFSHWWLARFRYGPAEWLWRAITYMKIPAMRIDSAPAAIRSQPTA